MGNETVLEKLKEARVFRVKISEDKKTLNFKEKCDGYFNLDLTFNEVMYLAEELEEIARNMEE